jgi:hypothetical protein
MRTSRIDGGAVLGDTRRKPARGSPDGVFARLMEGAPPATADPAAAPGAAMGIDSLLALQSAADDPESALVGRAIAHGGEVLDRLERLRRDLLAGTVPLASLTALAHSVRAERIETADEHLNTILDAIELRAGVELAKLERRR